jgi:adhesin transport system outer membrane protein
MKIVPSIVLFILLFIIFLPLTTFALSLNEAIVTVVENNPEVKEKVKFFNTVKKDQRIAFSGYLPTLDVQAGIGRELTKDGSTKDEKVTLTRKEAAIILRQDIFTGLDTWNLRNKEEERAYSAAYAAIAKANEIALKMANVYIELLKQKKLLELAEEKLETHTRINNKIKERINSGVGTNSELDQSDARLALAYSNVIVHQNNFEDAVTNFRNVYGADFDIEQFELPNPDFPLPITIEEAIKEAFKSNPEIISQVRTIKAVKLDKKITESSFYPKVYVEADYAWNEDIDGIRGDGYSTRIMLKASMNLFNGGADYYRKQKNVTQKEQEIEILRNIKRRVKQNLRFAWMSYSLLEKQITYLNKHKKFSKKTLDSYYEEFKLGRRTLLDILNTEEEYFASQRELIKADYDYMLSKYRIVAYIGTLTDILNTSIKNNVKVK